MTTDGKETIERLSDEQIESRLETQDAWVRSGEVIQRTFNCGDFDTAMAFVNAVAQCAQSAGHHPDMLVRYSKVTLSLSTHDAGGLTERDFALATKADACFTQVTG